MRLLLAICSLQLFLLLFLVVEIKSDDNSAEHAAQVTDNGDVPIGAYSMLPAMDEERLRQIIREEVRYLSQDIREARQAEGNAPAIATEDPQVLAQQMDYVAQQIEYYKSLGSISSEEMDELQFEVARLGSAGRKQMMSRLVSAMNAGEIRGKLQ